MMRFPECPLFVLSVIYKLKFRKKSDEILTFVCRYDILKEHKLNRNRRRFSYRQEGTI